ncbi:MAG: hypothetical protein AB1631_08315 [Acidobacteriota bacterium]
MNNGPTSNSPYAGSGFVSQVDVSSDAFGMYVNRDDRSEYIELNRDGTFLQYERNAQSIGRYMLDRGALRVMFSDGRTAKMFMYENYFTDQQGRTWVKKERTRPSAPLAPRYSAPLAPSYPAPQPARNTAVIWVSVIVAVAAFVIVATQWKNIERWARKSSSAHYSENSASWGARALPGTGMTVELPGEPDRDEASINAMDSPYISDAQVYGKEYDNLEYVMMYIFAKGGVALDAEEGARGGMEEFKREPKVTGLDYRITTQSPEHVSISGTCIYLGNAASVEGLVKTKGSKLWAIFIISRTSDVEAYRAAKRILSSARFE